MIVVGTIVRLNSGGPDMNVTNLTNKTGTLLATCEWETAERIECHDFPVACLTVVRRHLRAV